MIVNIYLTKALRAGVKTKSVLLRNGLITTLEFPLINLTVTLISVNADRNHLSVALNTQEEWELLSNHLLGF